MVSLTLDCRQVGSETESVKADPQQGLLFGERFLESYLGPRLLTDPRAAMVELIANCWDAGATSVKIEWPAKAQAPIKVADNGSGMTEDQLTERWRTLAYDRIGKQGEFAEFPPSAPPQLAGSKRRAFGRNGLGRLAAFCFGDAYEITTRREGKQVVFEVTRGKDAPLVLKRIKAGKSTSTGTEIVVRPLVNLHRIDAEDLRKEIGLRFTSDPRFSVTVNGKQVGFSDVPKEHTGDLDVEVEGVGRITILVLDTKSTDRTARQHGIAWHVRGRLVGECSWRSFTDQAFIDGRSQAAKRHTFIVNADVLESSVVKDWSGFEDNHAATKARTVVSERIRQYLLEASKDQREQVFEEVVSATAKELADLDTRGRRKWETFVRQVQVACPSIGDKDLKSLGEVLAKLEASNSKFGLIAKLHELDPKRLDQLHDLLKDWTIDMARDVLDELRGRLLLVDELKKKAFDEAAHEVHELQPIFQRGLWIFGPEFETIEFTSNERMTTVVHKLFNKSVEASKNRPDFAIVPDGTVGLYTYPLYDGGDQGEVGIAKLVIVELKRAGVRISTTEKAQCWKYVKELLGLGLVTTQTRVTCFVLGSEVDPQEALMDTKHDGRVEIRPLLYSSVLDRAKSRLLKLYDRVKDAPFMKEAGADLVLQPRQKQLFGGAVSAGT